MYAHVCMLSSHVEHESQKDESKDRRRGPELYPPGGVPVAAAVAAEVLVVSCQELLLRLAHGTERESERENAATPNRGYKGAILHADAIHTYMHAGKYT